MPTSVVLPLVTSLLASLLLFLGLAASMLLSSADFYSWEREKVISGGVIDVHLKSFGVFSFFFYRVRMMVKQIRY